MSTAPPAQSSAMEDLGRTFAAASTSYRGPLDDKALLREAEAATGLADWGGDAFAEAGFRTRLKALCRVLVQETRWSPAGRSRAHSRLHTMLCSRLRFLAWRRAHPARAGIVAPVIATGIPRTGTTFLFNLLAQDPAWLTPTAAQAAIPVPPPAADPGIESTRNEVYQRILDFQGFSDPGLRAIHPYGADIPEECIFIQEGSCGSVFRTFFDVPGFPPPGSAAQDAYDWQIAVMEVLGVGQSAGRWLLKSPVHLILWDRMMAAFPDARVIVNHRDPAAVIPSIASLSAKIRTLFYDEPVDPHALGRQMLQTWSTAMDHVTAWRDAHPDAVVADVDYRRLISDPIGEAERIYAAFDLPLSGGARSRMEAFLLIDHHGKGSKHRYSLSDFGLADDDIEAAFGGYMDRFGVAREKR